MSTKVKITAAHLETVYRVMLKRIGKGYSAERLSVLIGKDHNYIEEVESFIFPLYPSAELDRIALALEESNHKTFYAEVYDDTYLNIVADRHYQKTKLVHVYSIADEEDKKYPLIMVREGLSQDFDDMVNSTENLGIAEDAIKLLIRAGYFLEARMPLEIFLAINAFIANPLHPLYIEMALMGFCGDFDSLAPLRIVENVIDGFKYEER